MFAEEEQVKRGGSYGETWGGNTENRGWAGNHRRLRGSTSKKIIILCVRMGTLREKTEWRQGKHPVASSQVKVLLLLVE